MIELIYKGAFVVLSYKYEISHAVHRALKLYHMRWIRAVQLHHIN